jgi:hypothetical protein
MAVKNAFLCQGINIGSDCIRISIGTLGTGLMSSAVIQRMLGLGRENKKAGRIKRQRIENFMMLIRINRK